MKFIDGLIDLPSARSIYAPILVVILLLIAMEHLHNFRNVTSENYQTLHSPVILEFFTGQSIKLPDCPVNYRTPGNPDRDTKLLFFSPIQSECIDLQD